MPDSKDKDSTFDFLLRFFAGRMSMSEARAQAGSRMRTGHPGSKRRWRRNRRVRSAMQKRSRQINYARARA